MTFPKDPYMLLSYVNTQLRDFFDSLDALCDRADIPVSEITDKLEAIGYHYDESLNQFK